MIDRPSIIFRFKSLVAMHMTSFRICTEISFANLRYLLSSKQRIRSMYLNWQLWKVSKISKHSFWAWNVDKLELKGKNIPVVIWLDNTVHCMYCCTCYTQEYSTQGHPTFAFCLLQKLVHVVWRECLINIWIPTEDVINTDSTDAKKPCNHDRCKKEPYPMGPIMLESKQEDQYYTSNWDFNICRISLNFEEISNAQVYNNHILLASNHIPNKPYDFT